MKFKCQVESFIDGILAAVDVSSKGTIKEFYGVDKINVEATKDNIVISAFGGKLGLTSTLSNVSVPSLNYVFDTAGKTTISSKDLLSVLQSFDAIENVIVELKEDKMTDTKELIVSMEKDEEQFQTIPCFHAFIDIPVKTDKFAKELKIDKKVFISGIKKVMYAAGYETERPEFLVFALTASKDTLRFSAGTGARHSIYEVEGKNIVEASPTDMVFMVPKDHTQAMLKALGSASSDVVVLKEAKKANDVPFHIVVECEPQDFILVGLDPSNKWPDENKVLGLDYKYKMVIKLGDLALAAKGTAATLNEQVKEDMKQGKKSHKAIFDIDVAKKSVNIKTNEYMRSSRKVALQDVFTTDNNEMSFACVSSYLSEIVDQGDRNEYIQLEAIEAKKPIVVYFYAPEKVADEKTLKNVDKAKGYTEKFITFFGTYSI